MKKILELIILRMRLASLFKLAEQHAQNGVEAGDDVFIVLYTQAMNLVNTNADKYPEWDAFVHVPALNDLKRLATVKPKSNRLLNVAVLVLGSIVASFAGGAVLGIGGVAYHIVLNLLMR